MNRRSVLRFLGILVALVCICCFALVPLFHSGYFSMHDDEQVARLQQMYLVISQGQFPPRWIPDLGFGFGYPLFNFYPPLVYYLGSLLHFSGVSFIDSTKIVFGLGFVLAAAGMFVWVRKHYGVIPGFFAAILYTYAPYHSVDGYVRGALSEFFSWIWIPLIFWSLDLLFEKLKHKYIVLLSIFFAFLMLSHTLVMLQLGPLMLVYVGFLVLRKKTQKLRAVLYVALGIGLGLGLSAYFWLPSLLEKQYTLVDTILTRELANYAIHFVCPIQLWSGQWGYGGSAAGCLDGLSFQIGKIQIIVASLGILGSIFFMFKKRILASIACSVLFLCSILMTLPYSKFLWDSFSPYWYIQFPWRFLLFTAVFSAFLGGFILSLVEKKFGKVAALFLGIILSSLAVFQIRNDFRPQEYRQVSDVQMTSQTELEWRVSGLSYEYVPKEVPTRLSVNKTTELAINHQDIPASSYTVVSPNMRVTEIENKSYLKKYSVTVYNTEVSSAAVFQVNTFLFPGWAVYVDGKKTTNLVDNHLHLIQVKLPIGTHTVVVAFENTPIRTIADTISIVTILIVGLFILSTLSLKKKFL